MRDDPILKKYIPLTIARRAFLNAISFFLQNRDVLNKYWKNIKELRINDYFREVAKKQNKRVLDSKGKYVSIDKYWEGMAELGCNIEIV